MKLPALLRPSGSTLVLGLWSLVLGLLPLHAADPAADALWAKIDAAQKSPRPVPAQVDGKSVVNRAYVEAYAARGETIHALLIEFVERYPADPRRWDAIVALGGNSRLFVKSIGADVDTKGFEAVTRDAVATKAWSVQLDALNTEMMSAPGVPEKARQTAYERWVDNGRAAVAEGGTLAEFRRRIDVLREKFPASTAIRIAEWQYLNRLRTADLAAVEPHLAKLMKDANEKVAQWAAGEMEVEKLRRSPMELKFTALDGREVDLAKLRGKVVLIDFWATWCGPCIAELPNVKKVYAAYRDKGFEIVSIALDRTEDRQKLVDMVAKENMPWPQYFDGKYWQTDISVKYGITGIPAMFLLDKSGRLVSTAARGPKLEEEVKRYLADTASAGGN
jgi:thiol-disulfide isomerase/thioredoxin